MKPEDYLLPVQIDKLKTLNEDKLLKDALYKIFLAPLYQHGRMEKGEHNATLNFALTPAFKMLMEKREMWDLEKLGADTLTSAKAIQLVEQGFGELEKFKNPPASVKEDENQGPI